MSGKKNRTRFILRLEGIKAADILARYQKVTIPVKEIEESFVVSKLPPKFTDFREITTMKLLLENGAEYPEYTNSRCKWDHYPFENHPIGIPIKYMFKDGIHYFTCKDYLCSLSCLKSFLKRYGTLSPLYNNAMANFTLLCYLCTGSHKSVPEANDWGLLDCYNEGEGINIDELRKGQTIYRRTHNIKLLACGEYYEARPNPLAVK